MNEHEKLIAEAKALITTMESNQPRYTPRQVVDAYEALIDAKIAQALDQMADRIEQAFNIRP